MRERFGGGVVVVTGGASGIGAADRAIDRSGLLEDASVTGSSDELLPSEVHLCRITSNDLIGLTA